MYRFQLIFLVSVRYAFVYRNYQAKNKKYNNVLTLDSYKYIDSAKPNRLDKIFLIKKKKLYHLLETNIFLRKI